MSMQVLLLKGDVYVKGPDFMCVCVPLYKCEGYIQTACINVRQTVGACESVWTSQFSVSNNRLVDIIV